MVCNEKGRVWLLREDTSFLAVGPLIKELSPRGLSVWGLVGLFGFFLLNCKS